MKEITSNAGGQPVHLDDFMTIQNNAIQAMLEVIKGLLGAESACIVSGLNLVNEGGGNFTLEAGWIFDGLKLCYVEEFQYAYDALKQVYLVKSEVPGDSRQFRDGTTNYCSLTRTYPAQYLTALPANSFQYSSLNRISSLLSVTPNLLDFQRTYSGYIALNSGYTARDGGSGLYILSNAYKDYQFMCAFTATVANGTICTLPAGQRPTVDLFFPFRAGSGWGLMLVKASTGAIQLTGAATAEGTYNYIQVETNINAVYPPIDIAHL